MLTPQQVDEFHAFGFTILRACVPSADVAAISGEVDAAMSEAYAHAPYDGSRRHWLPLLGPKAPALTGLTDQFAGLAEQLFPDDGVTLLVTDANRYTGSTGWHRDAPASGGVAAAKFVLYLEPNDADTGALRVIPGSHRDEFDPPLRRFVASHDPEISALPAVVCASTPGDVVVFDLRLWHASHGGGDDRRMCTIEFVRNPRTASERARLLEQMDSLLQQVDRSWGDRQGYPWFDQDWLAAEHRSDMVGRLREYGLLAAAAD